ncbi:hypothetical protein [Mycobacterium sp. 48b]|uniref:hypothetical protein n=1 Tax=Mycobacterium sp. 48b TaxID=3400426 RepID=UPI003AAE4F66
MNDTHLTRARLLLADAKKEMAEFEDTLDAGSVRGIATASQVHIGDAIDLVKYLEDA